MFLQDSSLLSVLLTIAATFLGLSLIVQVTVEMYKYLTSSKDRAYRKMLIDFLGPWVTHLLRPGAVPELEIRGPFQILKKRYKGKLLPLNKDDLIRALERTAPALHQRALEAMRLEVKLQADGKEQPPSQNWIGFVKELASAEEGSSGYWTALEIVRFLENEDHHFPIKESESNDSVRFPQKIDAAGLLLSFRHQFLPHLDRVEEYHPKLMENFEYLYKRRNIRRTFIIAFFLALLVNLPIDEIYRKAIIVPPSEALAQADNVLSLYAEFETQIMPSDTDLSPMQAVVDTTILSELKNTRELLDIVMKKNISVNYFIDWTFVKDLWQEGWVALLRFMFGCLVTSLLITFGAPFWNDLLDSLVRLKKGK